MAEYVFLLLYTTDSGMSFLQHIPLRGADAFGTEDAVGGEFIKVLAREVAGDVEELGEGAGGDGGIGGEVGGEGVA